MTNLINQSEKFLNETELAQILNMKPETLRNWRWEGKGPRFIKIGHNVRYRISDVQEYVNAQIRRSTSDMGEACNA